MVLKLYLPRTNGSLAIWNVSSGSLETLAGGLGDSTTQLIDDVVVVRDSEPDGGDRLFLDVRSVGLLTSDGSDAGTVRVTGVPLPEVAITGTSVVRETDGRTVHEVYVSSDLAGDWPAGRVGAVRSDTAGDADPSNDYRTFTLSGPADAGSSGSFIRVGNGNYTFVGDTLNWIEPGGPGTVVATGIVDTRTAVDDDRDRLFFVSGGQLLAAHGSATERITTDTPAYRWSLAGGNGILGPVSDGGVVFEGTRVDLDPNDGVDWSGTGLWSYTTEAGFLDLRPDDTLMSVDVSRRLDGATKPLFFLDTSVDLWTTDGTPAGTRRVSPDLYGQDLTRGVSWGDVLFVNSGYDTYRIEGDTATFFMDGTIGRGVDIDGVFYFTLQPDNRPANLYRMEPGRAPELILKGVGGRFLVAADVKANEIPTIAGTGGNDVIAGTMGREHVQAGEGNDLIRSSPGRDTLDGGAGWDIVDYSLSPRADPADPESFGFTGVNVTLRSGGGGGHATGDRYISIESVIGSMFNDYIYGDGAANRFEGRGGSDYLFGEAGNDTLVGNGAGSGWDTLVGGTGDDVYILDSANHHISERATRQGGVDIVLAHSGYTLQIGGGVENLSAIDPSSTVARNFRGNDLANVIIGTDGPNQLHPGTDVRGQGDGRADLLRGRGGNDRYIVLDEFDTVSEADSSASGTDTVYASVSFSLSGNRVMGDVENLVLQTDADLFGTGNALTNVIVGNSGDNGLDGREGSDVLRGGAGNDLIHGWTGRDTLDGGSGDDYLVGGKGADVIVFSEGFDTFDGFEDSRPRRTTYDGLDLIDVTGLRGLNRGRPLSMDNFLITREEPGITIRVDLNRDGVPDLVDIDRDGNSDYAVLTLIGRTAVNAEDFVF